MAEVEISRREMLTFLGAGTVALGAGIIGAHTLYEHYHVPTIPRYSPDQFPEDHGIIPPPKESPYDTNTDPLFRAANVSVVIDIAGYAHASLVDTGEDLLLSTAEHVGNAARESMLTFAEIPGVGTTPLDPERFIFGNKSNSEWETSAFYVFGEESEASIRQAVTENKITPLRLHSGRPRLGEIVAVPRGEFGYYALYQYVSYHPHENIIELEGAFTESCKGDSGSPILQIEDVLKTRDILPTGVSYGCLAGVYDSRTDAEGRECSNIILARPND